MARNVLALWGCALWLGACGPGPPEPDVVVLQHVLIGFEGSVPGKPITRSREEAAELAAKLLERARAGEDFDALVREFSDDAHPGIYRLANHGVPPMRTRDIQPREGMVPGFGNVGFGLAVGGIGLAPHHPRSSPYGWHLITRLE